MDRRWKCTWPPIRGSIFTGGSPTSERLDPLPARCGFDSIVQPERKLKPSMYATVRVYSEPANQRHSCYPETAVQRDRDRQFVFVQREPGSSKSATFNWGSPTDSRSKCSAASRNRRPSSKGSRAQIRAVRFADLIACYRRCRCPSANVSSWSSWPWPWLSEASTRFKPFPSTLFLMSRRSWFRVVTKTLDSLRKKSNSS